jgi:hypothetical protein
MLTLARFLFVVLASMASASAAVITPVAGSTPQTAPAGSTFANPLAVVVTDGAGNPIAGASVLFGYMFNTVHPVDATGCDYQFYVNTYFCTRITNAQGVASLGSAVADHVGEFTLTATVGDGSPSNTASVQFFFTVTPAGSVSVLDVVSGDNQRGPIGTQLPQPFRVRLHSPSGAAVAGAQVEFRLDGYGPAGAWATGLGSSLFVATDGNGVAETFFKPQSGVGQGTVYVRALDPISHAYIDSTLHFTSTYANGATTADFTDIWWNPAESGWGFAVIQGSAGLFDVLYTYDTSGQPTWYTVTNGTWINGFGSTNQGNTYSPTSAPYYAYDPAAFRVGESLGNLAVGYPDPSSAQLYAPVLDRSSIAPKAIQRYVFGDVSAAKRGVAGLWWGGPSQNGWGLSIAEQGGKLFVAWYTYGADGKAKWFSMSEGSYAGNTWSGPVYHSVRNGLAIATTSVGTFSIAFAGTDHATFTWDVEGHHGSVPISKFVF